MTGNAPVGDGPPLSKDGRFWWDGQAWKQVAGSAGPVPVVIEKKPSNENVIAAGFVCAILLPIVGLIIGLTQLRRSTGPALGIIAASIVAFAVFALLWPLMS